MKTCTLTFKDPNLELEWLFREIHNKWWTSIVCLIYCTILNLSVDINGITKIHENEWYLIGAVSRAVLMCISIIMHKIIYRHPNLLSDYYANK